MAEQDGAGPRRVPCVGAIIRDEAERLLLIQRRNEPGAGLWSLPGGRIEAGETDQRAVVRIADVRRDIISLGFNDPVVQNFGGGECDHPANSCVMIRVLPRQADEFTCTSCFLVHHRSQLAREKGNDMICKDCA